MTTQQEAETTVPFNEQPTDRCISTAMSLCPTNLWIIQYRRIWSRLILSPFYQKVEHGLILPEQYRCWLLDHAYASLAVLKASRRLSDNLSLSTPYESLPLLSTANKNAQFVISYMSMHGFDIYSVLTPSPTVQRLAAVIERLTAPSEPVTVGIDAVWTFMFASWQAWTLSLNRMGAICNPLFFIATFVTRKEALSELIATQNLLDNLLNVSKSTTERERAGQGFFQISQHSCAVLENAMGIGNDEAVCSCGRKGPWPTQCTFPYPM